jgi:hypothetical protein
LSKSWGSSRTTSQFHRSRRKLYSGKYLTKMLETLTG